MYDINIPKSMNLPVYNTALSTYDGSQRFRQSHSKHQYFALCDVYGKVFEMVHNIPGCRYVAGAFL